MNTSIAAGALSRHPLEFIRLPDVMRRTGLSAPSLYRKAKRGQFPRPVKIGERASAWVSREVDAWVTSRIAERDKAQAVQP